MDSKANGYLSILKSLSSIIEPEAGWVANLANTVALLKQEFGFWWIGIYLVQDGKLKLGPFQGPVACTIIEKGKGVCGQAWEDSKTIIVSDVHQFPGHIACSEVSNSEIVVPLIHNNKVWGVLDMDSEFFGNFDSTDAKYLEQIASELSKRVYPEYAQ
jgi:GAF domain-containing protein